MSAPLSDAATVRGALAWAAARLAGAAGDAPRREAEILLAHALERPRAYLLTHPDQGLTAEVAQRFRRLVEDRARGRPIAYLAGWREFWSRPFRVTPDTLIPRPETERLVELALERIPAGQAFAIADLGTGSGAIAITLALERPACRVLAVDASPAALAVARANAARLGAANVELRLSDWCGDLRGERFDLIVSNPPYVRAGDPHLASGDLRFEPERALVAGPEGLEAITAIAEQARGCLKPGAWLLLEHGFDQGAAVTELLERLGYGAVASFDDLSGQPRVAGAVWKGKDRGLGTA